MLSAVRCIVLPIAALLLVSACSGDKATLDDDQAQSYVDKAAINDLFEIQSSELALSRPADTEVKRFARMMMIDHARTSRDLKDAIQISGASITIPTKLDARHEKLLQELQAANGAEFDRLYSRIQMDARAEAIRLHRDYSRDGRMSALRVVAVTAVPILERHRMEAERLAGM